MSHILSKIIYKRSCGIIVSTKTEKRKEIESLAQTQILTLLYLSNLKYFNLILFDLTEFTVWNIYRDQKIRACGKDSISQDKIQCKKVGQNLTLCVCRFGTQERFGTFFAWKVKKLKLILFYLFPVFWLNCAGCLIYLNPTSGFLNIWDIFGQKLGNKMFKWGQKAWCKYVRKRGLKGLIKKARIDVSEDISSFNSLEKYF